MKETEHLLELNLEIEGMLRILDAHPSDEARRRLESAYTGFAQAMERFLASVDAPAADSASPATAYIELDEPTTRIPLSEAINDDDRIRFRRELFNGNDDDFDDTVALLSDMSSYSEAEDYLLNDMMWNRSKPAVIDFLDILSHNMPR